MTAKIVWLFLIIFVQGAWCLPATQEGVSYGSQFSGQFNQDLASVINNLHDGVTKVASPAIKLGLDTMPSLVTAGVQSVAGDRAGRMAQEGQQVLGEVVTGLGHAVGGAATAGSALAGGALQVLGSGLGVVNGVVGSTASAGVDLIGRLGDSVDLSNLPASLGSALLSAGGGSAAVLPTNLANLLSSASGVFSQGTANLEQIASSLFGSGTKNLESWLLSLSQQGQVNVYNLFKSILDIIVHVQTLFENMIKSTISAAGGSSTSTSTSGQ